MTTASLKAQWLRDNQKPGEVYAGLILGEKGEPDHHLFVMPGEAKDVTFQAAQKWAKEQGGDLPSRREQRVLFANAKAAFHPEWYWSGEQHASASLLRLVPVLRQRQPGHRQQELPRPRSRRPQINY
jgi:hypothetical protein